jgi:hypothetical protein
MFGTPDITTLACAVVKIRGDIYERLERLLWAIDEVAAGMSFVNWDVVQSRRLAHYPMQIRRPKFG